MLGDVLALLWRRLRSRGAIARAMALYDEAVKLAAGQRYDEAEQRYRAALALAPGFADACNNLGRLQLTRGRHTEAIASFRQAIARRPELPDAYINLGNMLLLGGDLDGAYANYAAALARDPTLWVAHNNRANVLLQRGQHAAALAAFTDAMAMNADDPAAASCKLNCENYTDAQSPQQRIQEYVAWGTRFAGPLAARAPAHHNPPDPGRRLRLGYVSPDFHEHAMSFFIGPLLEHRDRAAFEVVCYYNCPWQDAVTARFRAAADRWRDIAPLNDEEAARQIAADGIDLLVDLAGHTADNRLLVFARKPAPVQFTYLGYVNTTGVAAIDYRITDARADPPGLSERDYVERLLRLPDCLMCYRAPDGAPAVGPLPALRDGVVSFGSFNNFAKITDAVFDAWARLLARVPRSRLLMLGVAPGEAQQRARSAFSARGIAGDRLELCARLTMADYLALHNRVDIALDPFPFNGGATTCHALWMGVPAITLQGRVFVARVGESLLASLGLPELVAHDEDDYVAIAAGLAADLPRLAQLRTGLRERMRASVLCDAPRFMANLEGLYRGAWKDWCAAQSAAQATAARAAER